MMWRTNRELDIFAQNISSGTQSSYSTGAQEPLSFCNESHWHAEDINEMGVNITRERLYQVFLIASKSMIRERD